jgi:phospholipase C
MSMSNNFTRRRLLKSASGIAAAAAAALMPPNVQRVLAQPQPRRISLRDIKHVVILMQENRSFDHYFGTLAGVRGFDDPHALKLASGKSVFYQPDAENPQGYLLPFHLDTRASSGQKIPSTSHAWAVQHEAWNAGKMDQWLPAHRKADGVKAPYVMGYYTRADIPFQFALAEAFTLCDAYHCSLMGPTWPNRMYLMTGTIDPDAMGGGPILNNKAPVGGYTWSTYPERLQDAGVSWKVYEQQDSYGCNMLKNFKVFQQAEQGSALYTRGMQVDPEGQFEYDAMNDKLPAVSWIIPTSFQSEHPNFMPADGAAFVARKSMQSRQIRTFGPRPFSFSTTTRTTDYLITFRHRSPWKAHRTNLYRVFRSAAGSGFLASSFLLGQPAVGFAASNLTTHPYYNFLKNSRACMNPTLAIGGGRHLAISPPPFALASPDRSRQCCRIPAALSR